MCICIQLLNRVRFFATPWTIPCQAPLSLVFSKQEYQCGLPFPSSGDLPDPRIEPPSHILAGRFFTAEPQGCSYKAIYVPNFYLELALTEQQAEEEIQCGSPPTTEQPAGPRALAEAEGGHPQGKHPQPQKGKRKEHQDWETIFQ